MIANTAFIIVPIAFLSFLVNSFFLLAILMRLIIRFQGAKIRLFFEIRKLFDEKICRIKLFVVPLHSNYF